MTLNLPSTFSNTSETINSTLVTPCTAAFFLLFLTAFSLMSTPTPCADLFATEIETTPVPHPTSKKFSPLDISTDSAIRAESPDVWYTPGSTVIFIPQQSTSNETPACLSSNL